MRSGGGVLLIGSLQLLVGLVLLFIYEGYKSQYFEKQSIDAPSAPSPNYALNPQSPSPSDPGSNPGGGDGDTNNATAAMSYIINNIAYNSLDGEDSTGRFLNTPMDIIFYLSIVNNVFSVMGLAAGDVARIRVLVPIQRKPTHGLPQYARRSTVHARVASFGRRALVAARLPNRLERIHAVTSERGKNKLRAHSHRRIPYVQVYKYRDFTLHKRLLSLRNISARGKKRVVRRRHPVLVA